MPDIAVNAKLTNPLSKLEEFVVQFKGRILFCAESAGRREVLTEMLGKIGLKLDEIEHWQLCQWCQFAIPPTPSTRSLLPTTATLSDREESCLASR